MDLTTITDNLTGPHGLALILNLILFVIIRPVFTWLSDGRKIDFQVTLIRAFIVLFLVLQLLELLIGHRVPKYESIFSKLGWTIALIYGAMLSYYLVSRLSRRRFGNQRLIDERVVYLDSYNSRLVDIIGVAALLLIGLFLLIKIWELDSLLEATGLLGLVFAFLALTNAIWAPDLYFGLVILNSDMLEDGDTVRLGDGEGLYIINKVTFIYTILLNVANNHRTLLRNSKLLEQRIENLTKRASTDGLRQSLHYKIGYPPVEGLDSEHRIDQLNQFQKRVERMFQSAIDAAKRKTELKLNPKQDPEWRLVNAGDHALEYELYFYLEALPVTKVTRTIRQHLLNTRYQLNAQVYQSSVEQDLSLATPLTLVRLPAPSPWPQPSQTES